VDIALILASASPRRRALLKQLGVEFRVDPADIDESSVAREAPEVYVKRMARDKAARVAARHDLARCAVLAADTAVVIDQDILGKPLDHFDGLAMLARLSGRRHTVVTGLCLQHGAETRELVCATAVDFITIDRETCEAYLATDEPWDKAGAYAIQGLAGAFVRGIEGSYSNVVGLPLAETWELLQSVGVATGLERCGE
jgi:septum formation protein